MVRGAPRTMYPPPLISKILVAKMTINFPKLRPVAFQWPVVPTFEVWVKNFEKKILKFLEVLEGLERSGVLIVFMCPIFVKNARCGAEL